MDLVAQVFVQQGIEGHAEERGRISGQSGRAGFVDVHDDAGLIHEQEGFGWRIDQRSGLGFAVTDMGIGQTALFHLEAQVAGAAINFDFQSCSGLAQVPLGADTFVNFAFQFIVGGAQVFGSGLDGNFELLFVAA